MDRDFLLQAVRPYIIRSARRFAAVFERPYMGFEDYKSLGYLQALEALDRFRPPDGLPPNEVKALWIAFATRRIRGAMLDELRYQRSHDDTVLPVSFMDDYWGRVLQPDLRTSEQQTEELRITLRRFLTAEEFALTDAYFFEHRSQASLARERGCSQAAISIQWQAICHKLKSIPEFLDYIRDT